ncbi:MAG: hypothetical protein ACFB2W_25085 [Leptolyngbyaceae cyanobacterium]
MTISTQSLRHFTDYGLSTDGIVLMHTIDTMHGKPLLIEAMNWSSGG